MKTEMQFHEYANLFPMMNNEELSSLVEDMRTNGYDATTPIITYQSRILDGRNRYRASLEAGVEPVYQEFEGTDVLGFVIRHNLKRRHLNESQRAVIAAKLANMDAGNRAGSNQYERKSANLQDSISQPKAAEMLNVSPRTVATIKAIEKTAPELIEKIERGEMTAHEANKKVNQIKKTEKRAEMSNDAGNILLSDSTKILVGDFRTASLEIPDNSIDIIFTDPPYDEETIPLYEDMAIMAKRVLKPGGSLITYVGHYAIPSILPLMTPHLRFWWTLCLNYAEGPYNRLTGKNIFVQWKPLLWFVKGGRWNSEFVADRIDAPAPSKLEHDWQQGEVDYYINKLAEPNGVVLDPFLGSGTTLIAALKVGRRGIGIEVNPKTASVAKTRIFNEMKGNGI